MKECLICGNTNAREIKLTTLHSDEDGNYDEQKMYLCEEGKGCS